jgi:hypothetical protein
VATLADSRRDHVCSFLPEDYQTQKLVAEKTLSTMLHKNFHWTELLSVIGREILAGAGNTEGPWLFFSLQMITKPLMLVAKKTLSFTVQYAE